MKRLVASFAAALVLVGGCAASVGASAPVQKANYPTGLAKFDMPEGWPAVYTWCSGGVRVTMSYQSEGGAHNNPSLALTSATDPGCLR